MVSSVFSFFLESDLLEFDPVSELVVEKLIKLLSSKSCVSNPLPTWMIKQYLPVLLPFITNIVNFSLSTSTVPNQFKSAVIIPILKKPSLESNVLKNFRPVANLLSVYFKGGGKSCCSANFNTFGEEWFEWCQPVCVQKMSQYGDSTSSCSEWSIDGKAKLILSSPTLICHCFSLSLVILASVSVLQFYL